MRSNNHVSKAFRQQYHAQDKEGASGARGAATMYPVVFEKLPARLFRVISPENC